MKKLIERIRDLLGIEETVEKIESPITKIVSKLGALEDKQVERARLNREAAERALELAKAAEAAAKRAAARKQRYELAFAE